MEQIKNIPREAATNEPASSFTPNTLIPETPIRDPAEDFGILEEAAIDAATGRAPRHDGWTPERKRIFLTILSHCGIVADAARAAGVSTKSAYGLRNRAEGRTFLLAWDAALLIARGRLADSIMSRAVNGWTEVIRRDGQVVGERNRYDNRLSMAMLTRLDEKAHGLGEENQLAQGIAQEFDQFVDFVCGEGDGAAAFIDRTLGYHKDEYRRSDEVELLARLRKYGKSQAARAADEIDVSDLDPGNMAHWTADQAERNERSGFVNRMTAVQRSNFEARRGQWRQR